MYGRFVPLTDLPIISESFDIQEIALPTASRFSNTQDLLDLTDLLLNFAGLSGHIFIHDVSTTAEHITENKFIFW